MALHFYANKEDIFKENSINDYKEIFKDYKGKKIYLDEALKDLYKVSNISESKINTIKEDILSKSSEFIEKNFYIINKKFPKLTKGEAQIICSYNCIPYESNFSPYIILNTILCEENNYEQFIKVSKYFYIFLKALRKLDRYYIGSKYLYKCIHKKVPLQFNIENGIVYKRGQKKCFHGFTSFSTFIKKNSFIKNKNIYIKSGTIFALYGDIYGYDISLFNQLMEEEIILEPEQKCIIVNAIPSNNRNEFINIRLKSEKYNNILPNITNENFVNFNYDFKETIKLTYKLPNYHLYQMNILGSNFLKKNKQFLSYIYNKVEYHINNIFYFNDDFYTDTMIIYLKGFDKVSDLSEMFEDCEYLYSIEGMIITPFIVNMKKMFKRCSSLSYIENIIKWNTSNVTDMSYMFYECENLKSLPDISNWDTSKVTNINSIFIGCRNLLSLPDISLWNTSKMINMSYAFHGCSSLKSLPDISRWDISNANDIKFMFSHCSSLSTLPDISIWNISKVKNMEYLFSYCSSLSRLPEISKWNISLIKDLSGLFRQCRNLLYLPDISKWDITNVINISYLFDGCSKLKKLPNISIWNTSNIYYLDSLFSNCSSLLYLPDISKWDLSNIISINSLFKNCSSLTFLPDISKWNTSNIKKMNSAFQGCKSLLTLPDISNWDISSVISMEHMFDNCKQLSFFPDISKWRSDIFISLSYMFNRCSSLTSIPNLSGITRTITKNVNMFSNCTSLSYIPNLYERNIEKEELINSINCLYN